MRAYEEIYHVITLNKYELLVNISIAARGYGKGFFQKRRDDTLFTIFDLSK